MGRAKILDLREARQAVLRIIGAGRQEALLTEQEAKAALDKATDSLPSDAKKLFWMIARNPGRPRRYYQQGSHMNRREFRNGLRELGRRGLISKKVAPTTGGRRRVCYFPVVAGNPTTTPKVDDTGSC
jgi:hypothetical protein